MKQIAKKKEPGPRARGNTRDTRRWCRGKVGIPHTYELKEYFALKHPSLPRLLQYQFLINVCTRCGRHASRHKTSTPLPTSPTNV